MRQSVFQLKRFFFIHFWEQKKYVVEFIWIVLQIAFQKYSATPDSALIKLDSPVRFSDSIRPICLSDEDTLEKPLCSDTSRDRGTLKKALDNNL